MVRLNSNNGLRGTNSGTANGISNHAAKHVAFHVETEENCITFAATVHTTLPIRTASQGVSFAFNTFR
jgi:hypothetical protein